MELAAGIEESGLDCNSLFSLFTISIDVTDDGFRHLRDVSILERSVLNLQ